MKIKPFPLLCVILTLVYGSVFAQEAYLTVNAGAHTGLIRQIIVDDGEFITCSDDKTIRTWNPLTGKEERKILGQIGPDYGEIYSIAISPNRNWLASCGFLEKGSGVDYNYIRIHEYNSGAIEYLLYGHGDTVTSVDFSGDGRYLASASQDGSVCLWDAESGFSLSDIHDFHTSAATGVKIYRDGADWKVVSVGYDGQVILYSVREKRLLRRFRSTQELTTIAVSDTAIAASGPGGKIYIFDLNLRKTTTLTGDFEVTGLAFSPDGTKILAGMYSEDGSASCVVFDTAPDGQRVSSYSGHGGFVMAVSFVDEHTAVSAGGIANEIHVWDIDSGTKLLAGQSAGKIIRNLGYAAGRLHFEASRKMVFEMSGFNLMESGIESTLYGLSKELGGIRLYTERGGGFGYDDGVLVIEHNDGSIAKIANSGKTGYVHNVYGIVDGKMIISGGFNGSLLVYDTSGQELYRLLGHSGTITALAVEGHVLVTAAEDQIVNFWDLSRPGDKQPFLSFFAGYDDEWVLWTEEGYYHSSIRGDVYVGYHINQGSDNQASYYSSDRFYRSLYRPDIVKAKINAHVANLYPSGNGTPKSPPVNVFDIIPPEVHIVSPHSYIKTVNSSLTVEFSVRSGTPVDRIQIYKNGALLSEFSPENRRGLSQNFREEIPLDFHSNRITILAAGKNSIGDPKYISVYRSTEKPLPLPSLYLISIGISSHQNRKYNLSYADDDAVSVVDLFEDQQGLAYSAVNTKLLTESTATKEAILEAFGWLGAQTMSSEDVVVIFIAGHGITSTDGGYYFVAHDTIPGEPEETAVQWTHFSNLLNSLPTKTILMADTCHSGNVIGGFANAVKRNYNEGAGQIVFAATTGDLPSFEHPSWGHGAFTKAFIEGVGNSSADVNQDGVVSIFELNLVISDSVKRLTNNRQSPTVIIPESTQDFSLCKLEVVQ